MKIIAIADLHGSERWKKIDISRYNKIIFLGDFCDGNEDVSDSQILVNLKDVIDLKLKYPRKVILNVGNHDAQYMYMHPDLINSGFRESMLPTLCRLFNKCQHLFQFSYQIGNYLFSHAGFTNSFMSEIKPIYLMFNPLAKLNVSQTINKISKTNYRNILFSIGYARGGMVDDIAGILWADKSETENDYLEHYHQFVGHSRVDTITTIGDFKTIHQSRILIAYIVQGNS